MEDSLDKTAIPTNMEGIAIHLSYINKALNDLNKKMDAVQASTVTREEWIMHLKKDEDHEQRIRELEKVVESVPLVHKLVYGCVSLILTAVVVAIIYLVIRK